MKIVVAMLVAFLATWAVGFGAVSAWGTVTGLCIEVVFGIIAGATAGTVAVR